MRAAWELWKVVPGRHVQFYVPDPEAQSAFAALGVDGALSEPGADVLGVFLQSGPSKLAIFQSQRIARSITIREDGSARWSSVSPSRMPSPTGSPATRIPIGLSGLTYRQRVAFRIPEAAVIRRIRVDDREPIVRSGATGPYRGRRRSEGPVAGSGHPTRPIERDRSHLRFACRDLRGSDGFCTRSPQIPSRWRIRPYSSCLSPSQPGRSPEGERGRLDARRVDRDLDRPAGPPARAQRRRLTVSDGRQPASGGSRLSSPSVRTSSRYARGHLEDP